MRSGVSMLPRELVLFNTLCEEFRWAQFGLIAHSSLSGHCHYRILGMSYSGLRRSGLSNNRWVRPVPDYV